MRIRNWDRYQHYRDRNPPWIKLHYELLSSRDWVVLDDASRVLAVACMLIASRNDGEVPGDTEYMKRVAYLNSEPNFKPLINCGFLEISNSDASTLLADASGLHTNARPETEAEAETETETETDLDKGVTTLAAPARKKRSRARANKGQAKSSPVWESYAAAYEYRYGAEPIRNARMNSLCCQLVDRLGASDAPNVAAYYLTTQNSYYVQKGHGLGPLVADAEKLRTEWKTGRAITQSAAREADSRQKASDGWAKVIKKHRKIETERKNGDGRATDKGHRGLF